MRTAASIVGGPHHRTLHSLGLFIHGALAALHTVGIVYNLRRRNWWDVAAHTACVVYDAQAAVHHARESR